MANIVASKATEGGCGKKRDDAEVHITPLSFHGDVDAGTCVTRFFGLRALKAMHGENGTACGRWERDNNSGSDVLQLSETAAKHQKNATDVGSRIRSSGCLKRDVRVRVGSVLGFPVRISSTQTMFCDTKSMRAPGIPPDILIASVARTHGAPFCANVVLKSDFRLGRSPNAHTRTASAGPVCSSYFYPARWCSVFSGASDESSLSPLVLTGSVSIDGCGSGIIRRVFRTQAARTLETQRRFAMKLSDENDKKEEEPDAKTGAPDRLFDERDSLTIRSFMSEHM